MLNSLFKSAIVAAVLTICTPVFSQQLPAKAEEVASYHFNEQDILNVGDPVYLTDNAYENIFTEFGIMRFRNIPHAINASCTVTKIFKYEGQTFASVQSNTGSIYFVDLKPALLSGEMEVSKFARVCKFILYHRYLKSLSSISENTAICYLNNFEKISSKLNEFDKKRLVEDAQKQLTDIRKVDIPYDKLTFYCSAPIGKYNFSKKGFEATGLKKAKAYDVSLEDGVVALACIFENVSDGLLIPIDEASAEKITKEVFTDRSRRLYLIYTLDLAKKGVYQNEYQADVAGYRKEVKRFKVVGTVTKIDVYLDEKYTQKLTSINP